MILVAIGSNLEGPWGSPRETILRALAELDRAPLSVRAASPLYTTSPFGRANQPDFVNAAARIETHLPPDALLQRLHAIERAAGRRRTTRWGPRALDLDLLDYHGLVRASRRGGLKLPHPGISDRAFVLEPIAAIAPAWRHPVSRLTAADMRRRLGSAREGRILDDYPASVD
jgi:2-amino-4-hydroxy-6-hydroxymethyldihydropteridine diphosphokinase